MHNANAIDRDCMHRVAFKQMGFVNGSAVVTQVASRYESRQRECTQL